MRIGFHKDNRGSVAMIVAVMLGLLICVLALSIDLSKTQNVALKNKSSVDATALATAEWLFKEKVSKIETMPTSWKDYTPPQAQIDAYAKAHYNIAFTSDNSMFSTNADGTVKLDTFTVTINNNHVIVTACPFAKDLQISQAASTDNPKERKVCATTDAWINIASSLQNAEIAFSLDYTTSMIEPANSPALDGTDNPLNYTYQREISLESAVDNILDSIFANSQGNVRVSIVPFGNYINLQNYGNQFFTPTAGGSYTYNVLNPSPGDPLNGVPPQPATKTINYNFPDSIPGIDLGTVGQIVNGNTFDTSKVTSFNAAFGLKLPILTDATLFNHWCNCDREQAQLLVSTANTMASRPELAVQPLTTNKALLEEQVRKMRLATNWSRFFGGFLGNGDTTGQSISHGYIHFGTSGLTGILGAWWTVSASTNGKWVAPSAMESNPTVLDLDVTPGHSTCMDTTLYPGVNPYPLLNIPASSWLTWVATGNGTLVANNLRLGAGTGPKGTPPSAIPPGCSIKFAPINSASTAVEDRSNLPSKDGSTKKYIIHITDGQDNWYNMNNYYVNPDISGRDGDVFFNRPGGSKTTTDSSGNSEAPVLATTGGPDDAYTAVCDAIKKENIEIFIILFTDADTPNPAQSYHKKCISGQTGGDSIHLYENVTPDILQDKLNAIVQQILARSGQVQIAH